jgi:hypothetical protein
MPMLNFVENQPNVVVFSRSPEYVGEEKVQRVCLDRSADDFNL